MMLHSVKPLEKKARIICARAARDVPAGTSWAFHDHRTMKEVMAAEAKRPARRRQAVRRMNLHDSPAEA
jgi:hypothetical protein